MAVSSQNELIWQGRLHIGDEPGIHGDAAYTGLGAELPFTIHRSDPAAQDFEIVLTTTDLVTFAGFPGHEITVFRYLPDPVQPFHSIQQIVATARFTTADQNAKAVTVPVGTDAGPFRLSVLVRVDTTANPGFYNDFVWRKLALKVSNFQFFASFGFDAP